MHRVSTSSLLVIAMWMAGSGCAGDGVGDGPPTSTATRLGEPHAGQYHLGPVDFAETEWHNACAPGGGYRSALRETVGLSGEYLAGVSNAYSGAGAVCDACLFIETDEGESIVARVVTYGVEQDPGDIDVSPSVFDAIHHGEYPRSMQWSLARCPDAGDIQLEYQTGSNAWWTSLWVRNARLPLERVEVLASGDEGYVALERGTDGTLTDASGFGDGAFTLRLTASDGQMLEIAQPGFTPGALVDTGVQFD